MSEYKKAFLAAIVIAAGTTVTWIVADHFHVKRINRIRFEKERAWLQVISNDLKNGKVPFDDEFIAKLETIINPLRKQGLID